MGGLNGHTASFRNDSNVRIAKFTALTNAGTTNNSTQQAIYAKISGANAGQVVGVTTEHFIEPPPLFFAPEGTSPTAITGTTPNSNFNLSQKPVEVQIDGTAWVYAGAAISADQLLVVVDAYGRVGPVTQSAGTTIYPVGVALTSANAPGTGGISDAVKVQLNFLPSKA